MSLEIEVDSPDLKHDIENSMSSIIKVKKCAT
jgi:hypothetical protein